MIKEAIRIGFTQREGRDYIPSFDGYHPGARQITVEIGPLEIPGLIEGHQLGFDEVVMVAAACFAAMNAPEGALTLLAAEIRFLLENKLDTMRTANPAQFEDLDIHCLQVGDTVTIGGITVSCERFGWAPVPTVGELPK